MTHDWKKELIAGLLHLKSRIYFILSKLKFKYCRPEKTEYVDPLNSNEERKIILTETEGYFDIVGAEKDRS